MSTPLKTGTWVENKKTKTKLKWDIDELKGVPCEPLKQESD